MVRTLLDCNEYSTCSRQGRETKKHIYVLTLKELVKGLIKQLAVQMLVKCSSRNWAKQYLLATADVRRPYIVQLSSRHLVY